MTKVLMVDDHSILRRGLRDILDNHPEFECCGEAESGEGALEAVSDAKPDAIIMDVSMPGIGGINATRLIHEKFPDVKVVLFTLQKSTELLRAGFAAGATAYVLKSDDEEQLIEALEAVMRGETFVTAAINPEIASRIIREVSSSAPTRVGRRSFGKAAASTSQD